MRFLTALLSATLPLAAQSGQLGEAQLLPASDFAARDGRPGPGKKWKLTDTAGTVIAMALSATAALTPVVIDYEHQTLLARDNGKPAPAAGWMTAFSWKPKQGLFATVQWTESARVAILAGEYRYISPVIQWDKATGHVQGVALAALTNFPAILGMDAAIAALNTDLSANSSQEPDMTLLVSLLAAIGLAADTTEAAALTAVAALKAKADAPPKAELPAAVATALGLKAGADETAALSAVASLKTASAADAGTLAVVTDLQGKVAALTTQLNESALTGLVDGAIAAGKFAPAHRDWLMVQGRADFAALTSVVSKAPVIPGINGQSQGRHIGDGTAALTADASQMQGAFGLTADQWTKGAERAAA